MSTHTKSWIKIAVVAVTVGILFVWLNRTPRTQEGAVSATYVSQRLPAPGAGQKKVILQNLGMT